MSHVAQVKASEVQRGSLLLVAGGFVIADTLSATAGSSDGRVEPEPFWYDTDGGRHFPNPTDGTLTVGVPTFRTQEHGQDRNGAGHALLNPVPGALPRAYCRGVKDSDLAVWESGTALASVTCLACRRSIGLVNVPRGERKRESNGI